MDIVEDPGGSRGILTWPLRALKNEEARKKMLAFFSGMLIFMVLIKGWGNSEHFNQTWTFLLPLLHVHGNQWSESRAGIRSLRNNEQKLFERLGSDIRELHCSWNFLQQPQGPFLKKIRKYDRYTKMNTGFCSAEGHVLSPDLYVRKFQCISLLNSLPKLPGCYA